ncbi:MAG: LytS/YhcK type 5TM receptor domain-containing protein [Dialister sp.]|nr:LytS/YhcK type 5TM receptor domain-containing protein [Dialister sp.]
MYDTWIIGIQHVWFGISIFFLILLLISRTETFRGALSLKRFSTKNLVIFTLFFTIMALCGTYWNVRAGEGIINFRAVGIVLAGFIGGPLAGTITGIVAGLHRAFFIHTDAAFIHGGLSIIQGIAAGFLCRRFKSHHRKLWLWALIYGFILEILFWVFFAFLTWPQTIANLNDFAVLSLPIILTNSAAISVFVGILEVTVHQQDSEKTETTKIAFNAVNMLFDTFRAGFKDFNISRVTDIIITALPTLLWTAVVYKGQVYTRTNYVSESDKNQGDAEVAILQLQQDLPHMPHLMMLPIKSKDEQLGKIIAAKAKGDSLTHMGIEFLTGICHLMEALNEYERLKEEESLLAEAEIRALQAQINPHFLYNTLNTISYYVRSDPDTARKLIKYMSDYFRHSLSNPSKLIPLAEEVHVIHCYVELEKARFTDRLTIHYRLPEEGIDRIKVPPLLLQPLVENAVIHGVLGSPDGGDITVGLIEHDSYYKIYVADTGTGIPKDKLDKLLIPHKRRDHIGLINVHQRLQSMFGSASGLHLLSRPGKGTIVYAKIPKITVPEEVPVASAPAEAE